MSSAEAAQVGQRAPQYGRASVENAPPMPHKPIPGVDRVQAEGRGRQLSRFC